MKINKKAQRLDYCKLYLETVKPNAMSREISAHILENDNVGNRIPVHGKVLGMLMRGRPELFKKVRSRGKNSSYIWSLVEE